MTSNPWDIDNLKALPWRQFADMVSARFGDSISYQRGEHIDADVLNTVCASFGNEYGQLMRIAFEFKSLAEDAEAEFAVWWSNAADEAVRVAKKNGQKLTTVSAEERAAMAAIGEERIKRQQPSKDLRRRAEFLSKWKHIFDTTAKVIEVGASQFRWLYSISGGIRTPEESSSTTMPSCRMESRDAELVAQQLTK